VQAQAARRTYAAMRDLVLESHPWRFARKRAVLAASVTAPDWGYTTAYPVPSDFLRLLSTDTFEGDHEVEAGQILTSDYDSTEALNIRYLARIEDTGAFTPAFVDALATRWAAELVMPVTKSVSRRRELLEEYEKICLPRARRVEGMGSASRREPDSDFLNSRL
jgi:hypothetical protein